MDGPRTLAIDVGGSGLKATVLSPEGEMLTERVRRETPYPCTPDVLLDELAALAAELPDYDRVSVGYPGAIRQGVVRDVTAFVRPAPGEPRDPALVELWFGYNLQVALEQRFGKPTRVANDADVQGCAVIKGEGLELVITLGTGVGCALFYNGSLLPHMELSHGSFLGSMSIEVACGDFERHKVGKHEWRKRVLDALETFETVVLPDHLYIGGGNAKKLDENELGPNRTLVPNVSGLLGGIALWERTGDPTSAPNAAPTPAST